MKKLIVVLLLLLSTQAYSAPRIPFFQQLKMCAYFSAKTTEYAMVSHGMDARHINIYVTYVKKDIARVPKAAQVTLVSLAKVAWDNRTKDPTSLGMSAYDSCFRQTQTRT